MFLIGKTIYPQMSYR